MTAWLLALLAGALFALTQYGRLLRREGTAIIPLLLLRFAGIVLLVALLLDARTGRDTPPPAIVALDASASWMRADPWRWNRALARARELAGDSLVLFGDSLRRAGDDPRPDDANSDLSPLVERAATQGRPVIVISDGESRAPASGLDALPRGSRVEVLGAPLRTDLAVVRIEAPRSVGEGDTLRLRVTVRAGSDTVRAGEVSVSLGTRALVTAGVPLLQPFGEHAVDVATVAPAGDGPALVAAIARTAKDSEPRNDTMRVALDVSPTAGAIWVSSAPDLDSRAALGVLRGLGIPTRGFLRVAPGAWRLDGSLEAVAEADVRRAVAEAPLLVLHGDTAVFGPPRALAGDAPLALMPGPAREASPAGAEALDEWYPTNAPASPAAAALAGVPWDSLQPVALGPAGPLPVPAGGWVAVEGKRGRRGDAAPFVVGSEQPRRVVVARATGMWRWHARGGPGAIAYQGLWGTMFDWLADGRRDRRAVVPERQAERAGEGVRWRLSQAADSARRIVLVRAGGPPGGDTVQVQRVGTTIFGVSAPLAAGTWEVHALGGRSLLPVNVSDELLPAAPLLRSMEVGRAPTASTAPAIRDHGIAFAAVVLLLCLEWVLRRRRGLR